jgi:hypothetical protein
MSEMSGIRFDNHGGLEVERFVIATALPAEKSHPNGVSVGLGEPHGRSRCYDEKCEHQLRLKSLSNIP